MNKNELENRNKTYIDNVDHNSLTKLVKGQNPSSLVICCSDSRVIPEQIFSASLGELFVIRTAGNVINDGELATLEYGIEHLGIKYVLVLGHKKCGAIHASIHREKGNYLKPILNRIIHNIGEEKDEMVATLINASKEVAFLKEKFPNGNLIFDSAIYDISTGKVQFIKQQ